MIDSALPPHRFFGKFRGRVVDNKDASKLGRLLVEVPAVMGMKTNWALPCTPYAGKDVGFLMMPPVNALVWVEFEGGDPDFPIWTGCFWGRAEDLPLVYAQNAEDPARVKLIKTASTTIMIDDTDSTGSVLIKIDKPAISQHPVSLTFNSQGAELKTGVCTIKVHPENGVTSTVSETVITETPEKITAKSQTITATTSPSEISMNGSALSANSPAITVTADETISVTSGAATSFKAGVITAVADTTTLTTDLNVVGVSSFTGLVTAEAAVNILGLLGVEGAANFALAVIIEGGLEVAGLANFTGGVAIEGGGVVDGLPLV